VTKTPRLIATARRSLRLFFEALSRLPRVPQSEGNGKNPAPQCIQPRHEHRSMSLAFLTPFSLRSAIRGLETAKRPL